MSIDHLAEQDYDRAIRRSFWRKILTRIRGESNELLPYDYVREKLKIQGQSYLGMKQIEINNIVGSVGRYKDFDRKFLPKQSRTKDRWLNIDRAHYKMVSLPPIELYKIGDIFFVKDGNHRVSVAREQGQEFIDAFVVEIRIPVLLTPDTKIDDLELKQESAEFITQSGIDKVRPAANIEIKMPGLSKHLLEHIDVHRWYLGEQRGTEVPYADAVASWFDTVYEPVIEIIRENDLLNLFPISGETDLYLWILEFAGYMRQAYRIEESRKSTSITQAEKTMMSLYPLPAVKKVMKIAKRNEWLQEIILIQEKTEFDQKTLIKQLKPDSNIRCTLPGQYDLLLEHIAVHRWYLGENFGEEINYDDAVCSWYDNVYSPIVKIIREQEVLNDFKDRTETDLYLWIMRRQVILQEMYGTEVSIEDTIERVASEEKDN